MNFRITDQLENFGSLKTRAEANLRAVRLLKRIEAELRPATFAEQAILVKYSGWGALPNAFSYWGQQEWRDISNAVREELTDAEYSSARASVNNSHYTSTRVIQAMWDVVVKIGLPANPRILEPSAGIGHFFGLMPDSLGASSVGVEIDILSGRIMQLLYPDTKVIIKPFEQTEIVADFFDCVIGNVPFGAFAVHDASYNRTLTKSIHDYFIAKSLTVLRPGGIAALITSRYSLDKENAAVREYYASKANLLGAIRLPSSTFKSNAGTEVVTDVLFFQRTNTPETNPAWLKVGKLQLGLDAVFNDDDAEDTEYGVNQYFLDNPTKMMGTATTGGSLYGGNEFTVEGIFDRGTFVDLAESFVPRDETIVAPVVAGNAVCDDVSHIKDGGFGYDADGFLVSRAGNTLTAVPTRGANYGRIVHMMQVRDLLRAVFAVQIENDSDEALAQAQTKLNKAYDVFKSAYGPISMSANRKAFGSDPDYLLLKSLEREDGGKADVFSKRTIMTTKPLTHVDSIDEALTVTLNEKGAIDWSRIAELGRTSILQAQTDLSELGLVYRNPEGHQFETADQYLTGNVKDKLEAAILATALAPEYAVNVKALQAVQPQPLEPGQIEVRLGAPWIPNDVIVQFVRKLLNGYRVTVGHSAEIATWTVGVDSYAKNSTLNRITWGTARMTAVELIEDALNGRTPTIYDYDANDKRVVNKNETIAARERQQQIKDKFKEWVWEDEYRTTEMAAIYNRLYNSFRVRDFDGSHLTFPGMSRSQLRNNDFDKHQKNAVWRILQSKSTLLGHVVGAGKSFVMAAAAMEMKRIGLASKPLVVVPNHIVEQWATEVLKIYPQANIFVVSKDMFAKGKRELAMSRIATGNYDLIIMSHRSFEFLPVSDAHYTLYMEQEIAVLSEAILEANESRDDNRIVKRLEAQKKRLAARLKKRINKENKDVTLTFEEMGIDMLFVDESDAFKNLGFTTKMARIAGLPNTESLRAFDMFMKVQYLTSRNRSVVFATGTPVTNTIAEMYTLMRYLYHDKMTELGMHQFDAWAANFAETVVGLELSPDGSGYRVHTRFARFINVPELITTFRMFADIKSADMLKLPRPEMETGKPIIVSSPASDQQKAYIQTLVERAEKLRTTRIDPREDNMLKVTTDGRKCALDIRLAVPGSKPDIDTKVDACAANVAKIWKDTTAGRLAQMVFLDISTPNERFNVYDDLRAKLVALGVNNEEIVYVHSAESDEEKMELFNKVNAGVIRILMGSTEKMGSGTNAQKRLVALHHMDAPWRPRDIEQREGRILRPGNTNPVVKVYRYVTEGSFDAYMWQTMETKFRFISQVICGESGVRSIEDIESLSLTYAEVKAIASGNTKVIEKVKVDSEIRKLEALRSVAQNNSWRIKQQLSEFPHQLNRLKKRIEMMKADIQLRNAALAESPDFVMFVGRVRHTDRVEAATALLNVIDSWKAHPTDDTQRAGYKGLTIHSRLNRIFIKGAGMEYDATFNPKSAPGTLQSIDYVISHFEQSLENEELKLSEAQKSYETLQIEGTRSFEHAARLVKLTVRQQELNEELDLHKADRQAIEMKAEADDFEMAA